MWVLVGCVFVFVFCGVWMCGCACVDVVGFVVVLFDVGVVDVVGHVGDEGVVAVWID